MDLPKPPKDKGGPVPMGNIAYQPPFLPIVFSVDTDKTFKVSVSARIVTPLGSVTVSGGAVVKAPGEQLPREPADAAQLIICQEESAGQRCEAYLIGTGRKMRIEQNGRFVSEIERNRYTIYAAPGSTPTSGRPPRPRRTVQPAWTLRSSGSTPPVPTPR